MIGRIVNYDNGKALVDKSSLLEQLSNLGTCKSLEYLSRMVLVGLAFTDRGILSKHLIQTWTNKRGSSNELRSYIHMLLLTLLRSRPLDFLRWGLDTLMSQFSLETVPSKYLLDIFEEAIQDVRILHSILGKKNLHLIHDSSKLQIRYCGIEDGIDYLNSKNSMESFLQKWIDTENDQYASAIETSLAKSLSRSYLKRKLLNIEKIPVQMGEKNGSRNSEFSLTNSFEEFGGRSFLGGEDVDYEGLLRIPWNIEVKLTSISTQVNQANSQSTSEYLRLDTFLGILC